MNWKELPSDDWHSETESAEERERLSEIERRLKASRPNPPHLDAVAWERIVSASENSVMPEQKNPPLAGRMSPLRRRWNHRAIGTIAAAWLSGVIIGSGVMFLMMDRDADIAQTEDRETPVELAHQDFADASASPETRPQSEPYSSDIAVERSTAETASSDSSPSSPSSDDEERLPVVMVDSMREIRSASWLDAPEFGPASSLRPFASELLAVSALRVHRSPSRFSKAISHEERLQQSESQRELARSFVPPPGATSRRILEELRMDGDALGRTL